VKRDGAKVETQNKIMGEICTVCGTECRGGFEVYRDFKKGYIVIDSTPDRNYNVCDLCNRVVCFDCSVNPDSGFCNDCWERVSGRD
jgi:hypothetical protein